MNILRWVFGFPLAMIIGIGLDVLTQVYRFQSPLPYTLGILLSLIVFISVNTFCFGSWVFLTCLFIPSYKKYAGLVPMLTFTIILIIVFYESNKHGESIRFNQRSTLVYSSFYIGMMAGYMVSYLVFKNKGWGRLKKSPSTPLHELYAQSSI